MNIAKALKVKNRLVGELNRKKEIFSRENSKRNDDASQINPELAYNEVLATFDKLVELKGAINKATAGVSGKLAELAEYKQYLNFIQGVPCKEGTFKEFLGYGSEAVDYTYTAFLNQAAIDEKVEHYQTKINTLQDEIDEYNAKTQVDFKE